MRRCGAVILFAGLLALTGGPAATSQDARPGAGKPYYHPHRMFFIPVNVELITQSKDGRTDLQLYSRQGGGKWEPDAKHKIANLPAIAGGKRGFWFTAERDGEFEFSVRSWYPNGDGSPEVADLNPILSVVIDTTLPAVRVTPRGNGVSWEVTDANLDPRSVELQARRPYDAKWLSVPDEADRASPKAFRPADQYQWALQPDQVLEVRVRAKDLAGNENYSLPVRVPAGAGTGASFPRPGPDWDGRGGGATPAPRVEYVNTRDFTVNYTVQKMGRSGIKAASLYVLANQEKGGWKFVNEFPVNIQPSAREQTLQLPYAAKADGGYGFFVVLESGAGLKGQLPKDSDQPMFYVEVDTQQPYMKITGVRVTKGTARGPLVELSWETEDRTLMPDPVTLEFAADPAAAKWEKIADRLPPGRVQGNSLGQNRYVGQYTWEIPDENVWKFKVRGRSVDRAGNSFVHVYEKEVVVDLEVPAAEITGVRGGAGTGGGTPTPDPPPAAPERTAPAPVPPASTTTPAPAKGPGDTGPAIPNLPAAPKSDAPAPKQPEKLP